MSPQLPAGTARERLSRLPDRKLKPLFRSSVTMSPRPQASFWGRHCPLPFPTSTWPLSPPGTTTGFLANQSSPAGGSHTWAAALPLPLGGARLTAWPWAGRRRLGYNQTSAPTLLHAPRETLRYILETSFQPFRGKTSLTPERPLALTDVCGLRAGAALSQWGPEGGSGDTQVKAARLSDWRRVWQGPAAGRGHGSLLKVVRVQE